MTDGVIKGTGNSRYLKTISNALATYPTYESFIAALVAGTFPVDFNGINAAGWTTQGTKLNKANLLTDTLCTNLGLSTSATPNQAMNKLRQLVSTMENTKGNCTIYAGSYTGNGKYGEDNKNTLTFPTAPKLLIISSDFYQSPASIFIHDSTRTLSHADADDGGYITYSLGPTTTWYCTGSWFISNGVSATSPNAYSQLNSGGVTYYYVAFAG